VRRGVHRASDDSSSGSGDDATHPSRGPARVRRFRSRAVAIPQQRPVACVGWRVCVAAQASPSTCVGVRAGACASGVSLGSVILSFFAERFSRILRAAGDSRKFRSQSVFFASNRLHASFLLLFPERPPIQTIVFAPSGRPFLCFPIPIPIGKHGVHTRVRVCGSTPPPPDAASTSFLSCELRALKWLSWSSCTMCASSCTSVSRMASNLRKPRRSSVRSLRRISCPRLTLRPRMHTGEMPTCAEGKRSVGREVWEEKCGRDADLGGEGKPVTRPT
jgi:hypothetical protein